MYSTLGKNAEPSLEPYSTQGRHWRHNTMQEHSNRRRRGAAKIYQQDRRAALLQAFDSMTDDAQSTALGMLQSIAMGSHRIPATDLCLVASSGDGLKLRGSSGRV
jgi:hypothetical protein